MAKKTAVWGIDIGQSALKALRCSRSDTDKQIVVEAFDYIEYPKILSQPDANAPELVNEALKQFLSRNSVRGDKVVISVPGQSGLARFIKLPPVETKKIPDIVRFEAKQQIPFPLEDVVWDYQQMSGGATEEGFALETEVGLFAMKREQVYKMLKPFHDEAAIEVDIVQLAPLSIYNYIVFDQMTNLPSADEYDPDNPPPSLVVLSLGTDTTDLVVTNGFRVWQRNIPVGGNHFTKALVKELKLNFGTAEHLKRNASQAEDPKALFQAMRPVFNDLLNEVQKSINFFKNLDKQAKITKVVALGNVMKLPGLQKYLAQNLGFELTKVDAFRGMTGTGVIDVPAFKDNLLAFGSCYGLALQGLGLAKLQTNLLPREIMQFRMIRAKKPWAVAAAATLLLGASISYGLIYSAYKSVDLSAAPSSSPLATYAMPVQAANALEGESNAMKAKFAEAKTTFTKQKEVGESFLQNVQNRETWIKFLKAVNLCLPRNDGERPKDIAQRKEVKIDNFECRWYDKLEDWYAQTAQYRGDKPAAAAAPQMDPNAQPMDPNAQPPQQSDANGNPVVAAAPAITGGPTGPGWVFQFTAHHYHNRREDADNLGIQFLRKTILQNLKEDEITLPAVEGAAGAPKLFPIKKLGIAYPIIIETGPVNWENQIPVPEEELLDNPMPMPVAPGQQNVKMKTQPRYDFKIQFCWQPHPPKPATPPMEAGAQ
jgi:type IV pilus assembly protein PilM